MTKVHRQIQEQGLSKRGISHREHEAEAARNRASVYSFLATLLNQSPDAALVANLRAAGGDFIRSLAEEASLTGSVAQGFHDMAKYVEENKHQPADAVQQDLAVDWTRLFRGLSPAYSPMPPYEANFTGNGGNEVDLIQEINELYRAHGLVISGGYNDRPDYAGLEFSFLQSLAEAEAEAWEAGNSEQAQAHRETAHSFLTKHIGVWINTFIAPAMRFAKTCFYHGFLELCGGVVAEAAA